MNMDIKYLIGVIRECGWSCDIPYEQITDETILYRTDIIGSDVKKFEIQVREFRLIIKTSLSRFKTIVTGFDNNTYKLKSDE